MDKILERAYSGESCLKSIRMTSGLRDMIKEVMEPWENDSDAMRRLLVEGYIRVMEKKEPIRGG